jgi:hypothetical protein
LNLQIPQHWPLQIQHVSRNTENVAFDVRDPGYTKHLCGSHKISIKLFIYGLFNNAISSLEYLTVNERMIKNEKNMEGSGHVI